VTDEAMAFLDILTLMSSLHVDPDRLIAAGKPLLHEFFYAGSYSLVDYA
jgi:hypothetical protein